MRTIIYKITPEHSGKKIQDYLRLEHGYSARAITKLKQLPKGIEKNGSHARAVDLLHDGDVLAIQFSEPAENSGVGHILRSNTFVETACESEDFIVYNKPPFMPVHTSCGHSHDTLCNVFASYCDQIGKDLTFRPVNRLDRDTSGAVLVAKNRYAAARLAQTCQKEYYGIVCGKLPKNGTVNLPIMREKEEEMRRIVHPDGQPSITHYEVLSQTETHSFVRFILETGRTHQIRVHMSACGTPLLGDTMYGTPSPLINRQALHCGCINFPHPVDNIQIRAVCSFPNDIKSSSTELGLAVPII